MLEFAPELDVAFYRAQHPDLSSHADDALREHYALHGRAEGRLGSPMAKRREFTEAIRAIKPALEIGPFWNPTLRGEGVRYFDVLPRPALQERARQIGQDPANVPEIDYVSPNGDLSAISDRFDLVVSSHTIEHQPDLVHHLRQVASLLQSGGLYALFVPDHRFCFDHYLTPSTIADVAAANAEARRSHTLTSVIEHRALTTHNDALRHWQGDHGRSGDPDMIAAAISEYGSAQDYIDVHAWQFTPASFRSVTQSLKDIGWTSLAPVRVYDTPFGAGEFCAVLKKM